ncbi:hypothetical protein ILUMI_01233 [Ignelater luminosus]|uniref:Uncharacterized protein n=1 Tax=Ignelater luminosus TaxID=2038154 RepID=A0A8K0DK29_IGNLU|nr:hypothetical protein ILUMI_01233 [Ignelater luminosus]
MFKILKAKDKELKDSFRDNFKKENIGYFIKELIIIAKPCNFESKKSLLIRDRIILGARNQQLQERLLAKEDINLETTERICRSSEVTKIQGRYLQGEKIYPTRNN